MNEGDTSKKAGKKSLFKRFTDGNQSTVKQRDVKSGNLVIQDPVPPTVRTIAPPPPIVSTIVPTSSAARPPFNAPLSGYDVEADVIEPVPTITAKPSTVPQNTLDGGNKAPVAHSPSAAINSGRGGISTTPLRPKRSNSLIVDEASTDDNSVATLNPATMESLGLFIGDSVIVRGRRRYDTVLIVLSNNTVEEGRILLNRVARNNLRVKLGDHCKVHPCLDIQYAERVHIVPFEDSIQGLSGSIFDIYLKPYFLEAYRPVRRGDTFLVQGGSRTVEFKVLGLNPEEYGIVGPATILHTAGDLAKRENKEDNLADRSYDDVGGYRKQMARLRELVEIPLRHPQLFKSVGSRPPRGVLIYGPPGTGKTLIACAVASEIDAYFFRINGHEIMSMLPSDAEKGLRDAFEEAKKHTPAIIFLDAVEVIASRREKVNRYDELRLVSQLLAHIDRIPAGSGVLVMAATSRPISVDPALRRLGRLEHEVEIGLPDLIERMEILRIHTKDMKLDYNVDLEQIAADTHGYVGADLVSLCSDAAMQQIREKMAFIDPEETTTEEISNALHVTMENFRLALDASKPSALRRTLIKMSTSAKNNTLTDGSQNISIADTPPLRLEEWLESLDYAPARCMSNFRFAFLYDRFEPKGIDTLEVFNELGKDLLIRDFGLDLGVALKLAKWAKDDLPNM